MAWKPVVIFLMGLVIAGCGSTTAETSPTSESTATSSPLDGAIADWEKLGIDHYLIRATGEEQTPYGSCTWITEVHGLEIDTRWLASGDRECDNRDVSVPALHREVAARAAEVDWADTGVPTAIEFEPTETEGEAESLTIAFQDLSEAESIRTELSEARQHWTDAGISSYRLELYESRNYWMMGCRWISVVTDGVVTEASLDHDSSGSYCRETEWTVGQLHDSIARYADNIDQMSDRGFEGHTLDVTFAEHGVPRYLEFDLSNGADEESTLTVTFTPTS